MGRGVVQLQRPHADRVLPLRLDVDVRDRHFDVLAADKRARALAARGPAPGAGAAPGRAGPARRDQRALSDPAQDPRVTAAVVLELVDTDEPPLRLFLGTYPCPVVEAAYRQRLETWEAWPLASRA
ncbi:hypothetical protein ACFXPN_04855 [Streptomyces griseorubiginosus]|uniref:hypothetical protein n=1 Tax=Streptomyces griseorubiginosus TaxID=67304 RepID=UPI0036CC41AF